MSKGKCRVTCLYSVGDEMVGRGGEKGGRGKREVGVRSVRSRHPSIQPPVTTVDRTAPRTRTGPDEKQASWRRQGTRELKIRDKIMRAGAIRKCASRNLRGPREIFFYDIRMGAPRKGQGGLPDPLDFDINFSHIITVAPRVEIQMHFLERG